MIRSLAITLALAAFASTASARPLNLSNFQMDRMTAGALIPDLTTLATTYVISPITLPAPFLSTGLFAPETVSLAIISALQLEPVPPPPPRSPAS
ncbi:MAG TPA: hypothetical protein VJ770_18405 [Stellaceae bacterium]|nr:hypothetical protein [Stellaceae bacterium]